MSYGTHLNRQLLLYSLTSAVDAIRHPIQRLRGARQKTALLQPAAPTERPVVDDDEEPAAVPILLRRSS